LQDFLPTISASKASVTRYSHSLKLGFVNPKVSTLIIRFHPAGPSKQEIVYMISIYVIGSDSSPD
tara:strand:- start:207 stop:401 length:195 start_codon:yes stop_codon:yes gene_type:complete